jgi:hypothetical protein
MLTRLLRQASIDAIPKVDAALNSVHDGLIGVILRVAQIDSRIAARK